MTKFFPLLLLLACGVDRDMAEMSEKYLLSLREYEQMAPDNKVQIASESEPGERLTLCLQFIDVSTKKPIAQRRVHFYHTDQDGDYTPSVPGDETTARLNGEAITDDRGRILVHTTLPGNYGSSADNRHIHTSVFGARPEAYDIHFKQYTGFMGARFIDGSDQHFLADLQKDATDNLVTFLTIEVKNP